MSITLQGISGEKLAREFIYKNINPDVLQQVDWLYKKNGVWYAVEVKNKEIFKPPPFYGHGLNISQVNRRMQFYKDTGIRCLFLVFEPNTGNVYSQWLDILENTTYKDTLNGVRVYNIVNFKKVA